MQGFLDYRHSMSQHHWDDDKYPKVGLPYGSNCAACPAHSSGPRGSKSVSACTCDRGYVKTQVTTTEARCDPILAPCDKRKQWIIQNGSVGTPKTIGRQWLCGNCTAHSSIDNRPRAICRTAPGKWKSKNGNTCAMLDYLRACTASGGYGAGWNAAWGTFKDDVDAHGVTAKQACCACGGGEMFLGKDIRNCKCDSGYTDADAGNGVSCVQTVAPTDLPTRSPTHTPTLSPTSSSPTNIPTKTPTALKVF